jgi:hypothetical protein
MRFYDLLISIVNLVFVVLSIGLSSKMTKCTLEIGYILRKTALSIVTIHYGNTCYIFDHMWMCVFIMQIRVHYLTFKRSNNLLCCPPGNKFIYLPRTAAPPGGRNTQHRKTRNHNG